MAKILKNQTLSPISISDLGISIPASPTSYVINPTEYPLFAASANLATQINNGNIRVNDGFDDLDSTTGLNHIQRESVPRNTSLITAINLITVANTTTTFTASSRLVHILSGSINGQVIRLPNAQTITPGHRYQFWNKSITPVAIQTFTGVSIINLAPNRRLECILESNATTSGTWTSDADIFSGVADSLSRFSASCGFDGNASNGRYLEFNSNVDSNQSGFALPRPTLLKEISLATQTTTTVTFGVYKFSGTTETLLTSVVLPAGQRVFSVTGLNIQYLTNEEIRVKCTAGAASRPLMKLFMVYN